MAGKKVQPRFFVRTSWQGFAYAVEDRTNKYAYIADAVHTNRRDAQRRADSLNKLHENDVRMGAYDV